MEANSNEVGHLYLENEKDIRWQHLGSSYHLVLGFLDERPISVVFNFHILNNQVVCFWESISQVVDYLLIEDFLKYVNKYCQLNLIITNATNFHLVFHKIKKDL